MTDDENADWHRRFAAGAFNHTWDLIDRADRTPVDDSLMLAAAFASRFHWERVGGDEQRWTGDWQIAHVASLVGLPDVAGRFAASALAVVDANGWDDWRLASALEGCARAAACAGDLSARDAFVARSQSVLDRLDGPDADLIASQLATVRVM